MRPHQHLTKEHVMRSLLLILLLSTCAVSQTPDPTPVDGRIFGTVLNVDGKPVPDATVYVSEESSSLIDVGRIQTRTDASGRFDFGEKLKRGVYEIYARKDKDGYPDPGSDFYQPLGFSPQKVQLFGERPAEKVTITLEDKAAVLTGRVFAADTGEPLKANVGFINVQTRGGRSVTVGNGNFRELIPANTDVVILVEEAGRDHAFWSPFTTKLSLQPGELGDVEIPLRRTATSPDTSQ